MLKKTITYTDCNDVERTEDFYFNLSKAEVIEMELTTTGGMTKVIEKSFPHRIPRHSSESLKISFSNPMVRRAWMVKDS